MNHHPETKGTIATRLVVGYNNYSASIGVLNGCIMLHQRPYNRSLGLWLHILGEVKQWLLFSDTCFTMFFSEMCLYVHVVGRRVFQVDFIYY